MTITQELLPPRIVAQLKAAGLLPTPSVLNIASGTGDIALALAPSAGLVALVDRDVNQLHHAADQAGHHGAANLAFMKGDWRRIPLKPTDLIVVNPLISLRAADLPFLYSLSRKGLALLCYVQSGLPTLQHYHAHPELADSYLAHFAAAGIPADHQRFTAADGTYDLIWTIKTPHHDTEH